MTDAVWEDWWVVQWGQRLVHTKADDPEDAVQGSIEALRGMGDWPEAAAKLRAFPYVVLGKPRDPRDFNRLGAKQRQYPLAIRRGPSSAIVMSRRGWPGSLQTSHTSRHRRQCRRGPRRLRPGRQ